jgi:hypothetical protein
MANSVPMGLWGFKTVHVYVHDHDHVHVDVDVIVSVADL